MQKKRKAASRKVCFILPFTPSPQQGIFMQYCLCFQPLSHGICINMPPPRPLDLVQGQPPPIPARRRVQRPAIENQGDGQFLDLANRTDSPVPMDIDPTFDPADLGLKEIGNLASWTVSSCKPGCGVEELRDEDTGLFWQ